MRIIAGTFARRRIAPPKGCKLRPTTDLAKEALFSTLSSHASFEGMSVLDLFAGTGAIGFEALSRGAKWVTFVEKNPRHIRYIKEVVDSLGVKEQCRVVLADALSFLKREKTSDKEADSDTYDFIFADPPYDFPHIATIPELLFATSLLAPQGIFVLEHSDEVQFVENNPLCFMHKQYSAVNFSFFTAP